MKFQTKALEFDVILGEIAALAYTGTTKKTIEKLMPLNDLAKVEEQHQKATEAMMVLTKSGNLPFLADFDILEILKRIKTESQMSISDLQYIRLFLAMIRDIKIKEKNFLEDKVVLSSLAFYFYNLNPLSSVFDLIEATIDPDGYVLSSASEALFKLRKQQEKIEVKRKEVLNKLLDKRRSILNEHLLILRNDRYCLPVKVEHKAQIKGIIHDTSSSGTTVYIEPFEASEYSSKLVETNKQIEEEIKRIISAVSSFIHPFYEDFSLNMEMLLNLDYYFSVASYSLKHNCFTPKINKLGNIFLKQARHPLIAANEVVPVNIKINSLKPVLMITGPNTGGKTVALKTLGLLSLMAQSGLPIPASSESEVSILSGVYADIGDHQSIKQSLSTFSSHIKNIKSIIDNITPLSLVLLDELGSGTDPNEGVSLAKAIIDYLLLKNVRLVLTTHYSELKIFAYQSPLIENASVKFDEKSLKPLYEIKYGRSGSSNALKIAGRLGVKEEILALAENYLKENETSLSLKVKLFEEKQESLQKQLEEITLKNEQITKKEQEIKEELEIIRAQKDKAIEKNKKEADLALKQFFTEAENILSAFKEVKAQHEVAKLKHDLRNLSFKMEKQPTNSEFYKGDKVFIKSYNQNGVITEIKKDKYIVRFGHFELPFNKDELSVQKKTEPTAKVIRKQARQTANIKAATAELDLRGFRYEEVKDAYNKFVDDAILANLKSLRIIHGFGTGAVRSALYELLKDDPNVKAYRYGGEFEGLNGVTIVTLI